jgi:hypothetical protein
MLLVRWISILRSRAVLFAPLLAAACCCGLAVCLSSCGTTPREAVLDTVTELRARRFRVQTIRLDWNAEILSFKDGFLTIGKPARRPQGQSVCDQFKQLQCERDCHVLAMIDGLRARGIQVRSFDCEFTMGGGPKHVTYYLDNGGHLLIVVPESTE